MIRGIGGLFIYARNAPALVAWYKENLLLDFAFEASEGSHYKDFLLPTDPAYGRTEREVFAIRQAAAGAQIHPRQFVVNLRVRDLDEVLTHLRTCGASIQRTETYDYGRFAWISDLEGNEIELFEPAEG